MDSNSLVLAEIVEALNAIRDELREIKQKVAEKKSFGDKKPYGASSDFGGKPRFGGGDRRPSFRPRKPEFGSKGFDRDNRDNAEGSEEGRPSGGGFRFSKKPSSGGGFKKRSDSKFSGGGGFKSKSPKTFR